VSDVPGIRKTPDGVEIDLKVVPGARRDMIAGRLGTRFKVRVSCPPEGGRANQAMVRTVSEHLEVAAADIELIRGRTTPLKTIHVRGLDADEACSRLL
jgi:hypothetical protein